MVIGKYLKRAGKRQSNKPALKKLNPISIGMKRELLPTLKCALGSYVFLWGQKQETTGTWYGLFLDDGSETEVMDVLEYSWTGKWPENRSPHLKSATINGKTPYDSPVVAPGEICTVIADVIDPDNDKLTYRWELLPESTDIKSGGDAESKPEPVSFKSMSDENGELTFPGSCKGGRLSHVHLHL